VFFSISVYYFLFASARQSTQWFMVGRLIIE
jgi:hypothetical protein